MAYDAKTKARASTDFIVIHCSATNTQDFGASDIDRWHRAKGWACIGYHYVIKRDGTLEEGRKEEQIGAHVEGHNYNSLGICMVGGCDKNGKALDNFTDAQWQTLSLVIKHLHAKYPKATIQGHRDFPGVKKDCPSFDVKAWLKKAGINN